MIDLGQDSVGSILEIIASSMLVTTFSITAMVTAYSSATTTAAPRATQLLIADPTSQNVLSTSVGSFAFSLSALQQPAPDHHAPLLRTAADAAAGRALAALDEVDADRLREVRRQL